MNISPINNTSFKANLYNRGREVRPNTPNEADISECGLKDTDIFVTNLSSENQTRFFDKETYVNRVSFSLKSPLFGERNFNNIYAGITSYNPKRTNMETENFLNDLFTKENFVETFENQTLKQTLLQKINENSINNKNSANEARDVDALNILESRLDEVHAGNIGLSPQRVCELYNLSREVNNKVAYTGSKHLLDIMR